MSNYQIWCEQVRNLESVLLDANDVFAPEEFDLGHTSIVMYTIDTHRVNSHHTQHHSVTEKDIQLIMKC